jgi:hypothetical protein
MIEKFHVFKPYIDPIVHDETGYCEICRKHKMQHKWTPMTVGMWCTAMLLGIGFGIFFGGAIAIVLLLTTGHII